MARRRSQKEGDEHENTNRWLVSYADFMTLMFAFFVVMYAISSVNEGKYRVLSDSLVKTFKQQERSDKPIQLGKQATVLKVEPQLKRPLEKKEQKVDNKKGQVDNKEGKEKNKKQMAKIADRVIKNLQPLMDKDLIKVAHNEYWVQIEINTSILFDTGSATLENDGEEPLKSLAKVLKTLPNPIHVEGHTDNRPIKTARFPSNWELSAARAASVVHLFMRTGVAPERLSAIGYAEFKAIASNKTKKGRRKNRRVVVVILGDENSRRVVEIK